MTEAPKITEKLIREGKPPRPVNETIARKLALRGIAFLAKRTRRLERRLRNITRTQPTTFTNQVMRSAIIVHLQEQINLTVNEAHNRLHHEEII